MSVLLDSVILIDHLNDWPEATEYLRRVHGASAVSVISRAEVLAGCEPQARSAVLRLLDSFPTIGIDKETADLAAHLRRKHGWRLPDAFQAALAKLHGLKLATRNTRDFPPDRFDFVVAPYRARR